MRRHHPSRYFWVTGIWLLAEAGGLVRAASSMAVSAPFVFDTRAAGNAVQADSVVFTLDTREPGGFESSALFAFDTLDNWTFAVFQQQFFTPA